MSLEDNKAVVRRHYEELFNNRNLDIAAEITAADYIEHGVAPLRSSRGQAADPVESLKGTVRWLTSAFPDLRIEVDDMIAEGDKVLAYITMRGTHRGEFQGLEPTGRTFEAKAMHLFRIRDGKAVEHWAVREDLPMLLQLGHADARACPVGTSSRLRTSMRRRLLVQPTSSVVTRESNTSLR